MSAKLAAWLEVTDKRTFAGAIDWPGWERSGREPDAALLRLVEYGPRYGGVIARSRLGFEAPTAVAELDVIERVPGNATTEFGAPGVGPAADDRPMDDDDIDRWTRIIEAAWRAFDRAVAAAEGVTLTTGPRGGGRSLDRIVDHVIEAETGYLTVLGAKAQKVGEPVERAPQLQREVLAALRARAAGREPANPSRTKKRWTPRYFIRRATWHVLDHTWEIEDRAGLATG